MAPADAIAAVVGVWKGNDKLVKQAASGVMAVVGDKNDITRKEVVANCEILMPVVEHFGFLSANYCWSFLVVFLSVSFLWPKISLGYG